MDRIRIGNDIAIRWAIFVGSGVDVAPYDLTGKDMELYVCTPFGQRTVDDFTISGHIISFSFRGKDQKYIGKHRLTMVENNGKDGMHTVDECDAFELVACSCKEGKEAEGVVEVVRMEFRSVMSIGNGLSGGVDPEQLEAVIGLSIPHDMNEDFNEDFAI